MEVIHGSACVPLTLQGPAGNETVRCWLDTGGGYAFVSRRLADRMRLRRGPDVTGDQPGHPLSTAIPERVRIGGWPIALGDVPVAVVDDDFFARTEASAFIPARILAAHDVVFDYLSGTFTIGPPGSGRGSGVRLPAPVSRPSHFPRVEVTVGSRRFGMLLDTGASHTMVSKALFDELAAANPQWPTLASAVGLANMASTGADTGRQMLQIPSARLGGVEIRNMWVVTRPVGTYEQYMSGLMTAPILGALAGNVLQHTRLEIHYRSQEVLVDPAHIDIPTMFCAPFSVEVAGGGPQVLEVLASVSTVKPGDQVIEIDGRPANRLSFPNVSAALTSTTPGKRHLVVRREGREVVTDIELIAI